MRKVVNNLLTILDHQLTKIFSKMKYEKILINKIGGNKGAGILIELIFTKKLYRKARYPVEHTIFI